MTLCLDAKHAETAVIVVKGDALYDAGNLIGRGSALWHSGGHDWGFIFPRTRELAQREPALGHFLCAPVLSESKLFGDRADDSFESVNE